MKSFLTLSMCLLTLFAGAQSFKKQKKQLLAEYNQSVARYDSLFTAYDSLYADFPYQKRELNALIATFDSYEFNLSEAKDRALKGYRLLHTLGKAPVGISEKTFDTVPMRIAGVIVGSLSQDMARVASVSHPEFYIRPDSLPRKMQLDYLKGQISEVQSAHQQLQWKYQSLHAVKLKMQSVSEKLNAARGLLAKRQRDMSKYEDTLYAELNKERELFREKGPKGFSDVYFKVFPEVFPNDSRSAITRPVMDGFGVVEKAEDHKVLEEVDQYAEFPGGMGALKKFIAENFRYPERAFDQGIEGKCYLQFVVDSTGMVTDINVKRGILDCPECDAEAVRLMKAMPKWIPARKNGKPVDSLFNLPVIFKIN